MATAQPGRGRKPAARTQTPGSVPAPAEQLEARADELRRLRQAVEGETLSASQNDATGEVGTVDNHPADVADFTFQRELDGTVSQILSEHEQQVQRAMAARDAGEYGICEDCGRPIPAARLQARPDATRCVECQSRLETRSPAETGADLERVETSA